MRKNLEPVTARQVQVQQHQIGAGDIRASESIKSFDRLPPVRVYGKLVRESGHSEGFLYDAGVGPIVFCKKHADWVFAVLISH